MRPFRLFDLPFIPLKQVLVLMNHLERVKLAVCAETAKKSVKQMNIRIHAVMVYLVDDLHFNIASDPIDRSTDQRVYLHGVSEPVKKKLNAERVDKKILSSCYQKENNKKLHFDMTRKDIKFDTVDLLEWLVDLFPGALFGWWIDFNSVCEDVLERLLPLPYFIRSSILKTENGFLRDEQLVEMMERMDRLQFTHIDSDMSAVFKHDKALSYTQMHYKEARWVRVNHLINLKHPFILTLGETVLDNEEINQYLRHWKSSTDNLEVQLFLPLRCAVDRTVIGRDLADLRVKDSFFIICDNDVEREHPVGVVYFPDSTRVHFWTLDKKKIPYHYEFLVLIRKRKCLGRRIGQLRIGNNDEELKELKKQLAETNRRLVKIREERRSKSVLGT